MSDTASVATTYAAGIPWAHFNSDTQMFEMTAGAYYVIPDYTDLADLCE